jgi:cofilin
MDDETKPTFVVLKEKAGREATYSELLNRVKTEWATTPRYIVYDLEIDTDEGKRQKIVFITWNPSNAKVKQKMIYAGTQSELKKKLNGIQIEIQATDLSEIEESAIIARVK